MSGNPHDKFGSGPDGKSETLTKSEKNNHSVFCSFPQPHSSGSGGMTWLFL